MPLQICDSRSICREIFRGKDIRENMAAEGSCSDPYCSQQAGQNENVSGR